MIVGMYPDHVFKGVVESVSAGSGSAFSLLRLPARAAPLADGPKALALLAQQVGQQAAITAIVDVFYFTAWSFVAMLPLVLLLRRRRSALPAAAME